MKIDWRLWAVAAVGILLIAVAVDAGGVSPSAAISGLARGSFGSWNALSGTLRETTPLLIAALAVFIALRAGLFNIGVEGQFVMGGVACAAVALRFPGALGMLLGLLAGAACGALWALPAGLIKAYRGGHEVITTIMLNSVAGLLTTALVAGPMRATGQEGTTTKVLPPDSTLPPLAGQPVLVSSALLIGILGAFAMAWWLKRTVAGYELRATGANAVAARFAGIATQRVTVYAMSVSGALAGLAGGLQVVAFEHRFYAGFSPGYGFDALGVALLAGESALGLLPAALLFGALSKGGTSIQAGLGVPKGITTVVLGLVIILAALVRYRKSPEASA